MKTLKSIIQLIFYFQLTACSSTSNSGDQHEGDKIQHWEVLISERQCAIVVARQELIKTQAEFDTLWEQTFADMEVRPEKPRVNFTEKWIIACYLGEVNTGGHEISIKEINKGKSSVSIILNYTKPGKGCLTSMAIEYPFIMAATNHFSENHEFKIIEETRPCE